MKAREIMSRGDLYALAEDSRADFAARQMAEQDIGALPVLDQAGRLEGIVTDRDLCCRLLAQDGDFDTPVKEIMTRHVWCVHPDDDVHEVEKVMKEHKVRRVPVVDDENHLQGFIATADLARHLQSSDDRLEFFETIESICEPSASPSM